MKFWLASLSLLLAVGSALSAPWVCTLPDTVVVRQAQITLSDVSGESVPPAARGLVLGHVSHPGDAVTLQQRGILRRLVTAGAASGVSFRGARQTVVVREGVALDRQALVARTRHLVAGLLPREELGAPATTFAVNLPAELPALAGEDVDLALVPANRLAPGRNHVSLSLEMNGRSRQIPLTVTVHHFREMARARLLIGRGENLHPDLFDWEWVDVGQPRQVTDLYGRDALTGSCTRRSIRAGDPLRAGDLKAIAVVQAGDRVELSLRRGSVQVSVPATARQEGVIGKVIPVRNELTNRLINARITGPGTVEWRN